MSVKIFYIRKPNVNTEKFGHRGDPIACVAYVVSKVDDGSEDLPYSEVRYALATVSNKPDAETGKIDQFSKEQGRKLALARLDTMRHLGDETVNVFTDSEKSSDITADIMFDLYTDSLTPSRVKKAAKKWLWPNGFKEVV